MDGRPANTDREERDARDGSAGFTFLGLQQAPPGGVVPVLQQRVICIHGETRGGISGSTENRNQISDAVTECDRLEMNPAAAKPRTAASTAARSATLPRRPIAGHASSLPDRIAGPSPRKGGRSQKRRKVWRRARRTRGVNRRRRAGGGGGTCGGGALQEFGAGAHGASPNGNGALQI